MPPLRTRRRRPPVAAALLAAAVLSGALVAARVTAHEGPEVTSRSMTIEVVDGPEDDQRVLLDASLYLPSTATPAQPAPAVVLAHGFGGSKDDLDDAARQTAHHGYAVLAYSARGFGRSTGAIGLDSVDYDVKDVRQLVDALARVPEVLLDGPGDPRVGFTGRSYGGGITLQAAAVDPRIDAVVPRITWSSLNHALAPNNLVADGSRTVPAPGAPPGVLKLQWLSALFGLGAAQPVLGVVQPLADPGRTGPAGAPGLPGLDVLPGPSCLGFVPEVCRAYLASVVAGEPNPATVDLLARSSPSERLGDLEVPTFLVQGEEDTLFGLGEAVRTAEAVEANGAPVKLLWHSGGHSGSLAPGEEDGGLDPDDVVNRRILAWWDRWLRGDTGADTGPGFEYALEGADGTVAYGSAPGYPAFSDRTWLLSGDGTLVGDEAEVTPGRARFASPPAGLPAAYSETSAVPHRQQPPAFDLPGQHVAWESPAFDADAPLVGIPGLVDLDLSSATGSAWLFAKLYDVAPDGRSELGRQVSAVRSDDLSGPVDLALPGVAHVLRSGHRLRLVLASTDLAYANRRLPDTYTVTVDRRAPPRLLLPMPAGSFPPVD